MTIDVATAPGLYAELRAHLEPRLRELTTAQTKTPVEACPGWSVSDVAAHVSGLVAETLAGVPLPRGSNEATARQVQDRRTMSMSQICDEWCANADAFAEYGRGDPAYVAALTSDLVIHAGDIAEALGVDFNVDPGIVAWVAARYGQSLQERALDQADVSLSLVFTGGTTLAPPDSGSDPLMLQVAPAEFLRGVTSRRSRGHVAALHWSRDPTALLDNGWSQYGPLR